MVLEAFVQIMAYMECVSYDVHIVHLPTMHGIDSETCHSFQNTRLDFHTDYQRMVFVFVHTSVQYILVNIDTVIIKEHIYSYDEKEEDKAVKEMLTVFYAKIDKRE